jgi:hypothetical protein
MNPISEQEVITFLNRIETGEIKLYPESDPQEIYAGDVTYRQVMVGRLRYSMIAMNGIISTQLVLRMVER